jgi:hypothetical protein
MPAEIEPNTRDHLSVIADAIGLDVMHFVQASRRSEQRSHVRFEWLWSATLLPRLFTAYVNLPTAQRRLQALRIVEAMATQTDDLSR